LVEPVLGDVIFDQDEFPTNAAGLPEDGTRVLGVMQNIHEKGTIKGTVGERQVRAVECAAFNGAAWAW
jgi:hypothetical protein